jgi:hypothetical protein
MTRYKLSIILVIVCSLIHLFEGNVEGHIVYRFFVPMLAVYFFPIAFILDIVKNHSRKEIISSIVSNYVLGSILIFSIVIYYLPDNNIVRAVFLAFRLINAAIFVYYFFIKENKDRALLHALFFSFM